MTVRQEVVLIGGRGIGRTLLDRLLPNPAWHVVCVIDDGLQCDQVHGVPVRGFENYTYPCRTALLALGMPSDTRRYRRQAQSLGFEFTTYIDPMAIVGPSCRIGTGSVILPFATVVDNTELGECVYLSVYAGAGKQATIGQYATLMNYSSVRGARVGDDVVLAGASHILDGAHIGNGCWVAPGAILRKPVPAGQFVWAHGAGFRMRPTKGRLAAATAGEQWGPHAEL